MMKENKLHLLLLVFITFLLAVFIPQKISALSCVPTSYKLGVFDGKVDGNRYYLDKVFSFEGKRVVENNIYQIDGYENLVREYIEGGFRLQEKPKDDANPESIFVNKKSSELLSIEKGDVVIDGPPVTACSNGFTGIFSKEGILKRAEISGGYNVFHYGGVVVDSDPGKDVSCESSHCKVEVNFQIGNESFSLKAGEKKNINSVNSIESITLVDATYSKRESGKPVSDLWGIWRDGRYVIDFVQDKEEVSPVLGKSLFGFIRDFFNRIFSLF